MAQVRPEGCCCGTLSNGTGWDGVKRQTIGYCLKKPRPGHLTCWFHRNQETHAKRLAAAATRDAKQ